MKELRSWISEKNVELLKENTPQTIYLHRGRLSFIQWFVTWVLFNLAEGAWKMVHKVRDFIDQNEQGKQGVLQKN